MILPFLPPDDVKFVGRGAMDYIAALEDYMRQMRIGIVSPQIRGDGVTILADTTTGGATIRALPQATAAVSNVFAARLKASTVVPGLKRWTYDFDEVVVTSAVERLKDKVNGRSGMADNMWEFSNSHDSSPWVDEEPGPPAVIQIGPVPPMTLVQMIEIPSAVGAAPAEPPTPPGFWFAAPNKITVTCTL